MTIRADLLLEKGSHVLVLRMPRSRQWTYLFMVLLTPLLLVTACITACAVKLIADDHLI